MHGSEGVRRERRVDELTGLLRDAYFLDAYFLGSGLAITHGA